MFAFLLLLQGNPSSSVTKKPEIRAQALLQVLHPKVREESYIWAIGNAVWSNVNYIIISFLGSYLYRYAFRKQHLTTYWEPVGQIIFTEASLQCTQRLYSLAKKDVERRNRQKRKRPPWEPEKNTCCYIPCRKIQYAVCSLSGFRGSAGKKSVASAKHLLVHNLRLSFQSHFPTRCGNAQRRVVSPYRNGSLPLEQVLSLVPHQAMLPGLPMDLPGSSSTAPHPLCLKQVISN